MARTRGQSRFDRWKPHGGSTIAYSLFRHDVTELNNFSWNGQGAINHVQRLLAQAPPEDEVRTVLHYGKDLGRRSDTIVRDARIQFTDASNWIRLASVVCMASLLELFIRRTVRLALLSDPGLMISSPGIVDGIALLKDGDDRDVQEMVRKCTEGTWSSRDHGLRQVFGAPINSVFQNTRDLQAVQSMRNSIAHDFARTAKMKDFWYLDPEQAGPLPINRVSPERLQSMLRIVGAVAAEIEERAAGHIGSFELLLYWHTFLKERQNSKTQIVAQYAKLYKEGGSEKLLSSYNYHMTGRPLGRPYCNALLRYYQSV